MDNKIYQTPAMYSNGAIRNLVIQQEKGIYKDWISRFYVNNTVPKNIQRNMIDLGAELIDMTNSNIPGMFWRFLACDDLNIDIFIVRDTDSRINNREEKAVSEWLNSNKLLHVMRDHPHHYYDILGGMWGYKNYKQRINILPKIELFLKEHNYEFNRMDDMKFLNLLYNEFEGRTLEHDDFFNFKHSQPFPDDSYQNDYYHFVGEIFDENDNCPNFIRDRKLLKNKNYKYIMKNKSHLFADNIIFPTFHKISYLISNIIMKFINRIKGLFSSYYFIISK